MDGLRIIGGHRLSGTVTISGAKNAALPIICATLLSDGESILRNVPNLRDIDNAALLLERLGRPVEPTPPPVPVPPGDGSRSPQAPLARLPASSAARVSYHLAAEHVRAACLSLLHSHPPSLTGTAYSRTRSAQCSGQGCACGSCE